MITLLGALLGFVSSVFPDMLKLLRDRADRQHELSILQLQLEQQRSGAAQRLEEISLAAEGREATAIYKTYHSGIGWVDALNGTVRPVLAYSFFLLYALAKGWQFSLIEAGPLPWQLDALWNAEDRAIFSGIIAFYFGQRAMSKLRK